MISQSLSKEEYNYLCILLQTIDSRNWDALEQMLRTNPRKFSSVSEAISRSSQLNGMTILHACIRFNPPPTIVQIILRLAPFAAGSVDCLRRTPLHIAAAIRADQQSIALLIDACPDACAIQDDDGKTPLHFACDIFCELFEGDEGVQRAPPSMDAVKLLAMASPQSVPLEDRDDTSALEYAILSDADVHIVKFLMRVTQDTLRSSSGTLQSSIAVKENIIFKPCLPATVGQTDRSVFTI